MPVLRPHARPARQPRRLRPRGARPPATSQVDAPPHRRGRRHRARRGVPRGARRQGRRAPLRQRAVPARRGARRGRARPVGPARSLVYEVDLPARCSRSATRRSTRSWPRTSGASFATAAGITLHVDLARGPQHPPHHRGHVQGRGPLPARRGAGRGRRRPVHQGRAVTADAADRGARLRHRQPALGPEGAAARRCRRPPHRRPGPDRATPTRVVLPGVGRLRCAAWRRCAAPGSSRWRTTPSSDGRAVPRASASACRCCSRAARRRPACAGLGDPARHRAPAPRRREAPADAVEPARASRRPATLLAGLAPTRRGCTSCTRYAADDRRRRRRRPRATTAARSPPRSSGATCGPRSSTPRSRAAPASRCCGNFVERALGRPCAALMELYPAIDLRGGRGRAPHQGDYDRETRLRRRPRRGRRGPSPPPARRGSTSSTSTPPAPASRSTEPSIARHRRGGRRAGADRRRRAQRSTRPPRWPTPAWPGS